MKTIPKQLSLILLMLAVNVPAKAQFGWDSPVLEASQVIITPQARDLLARLNWRYKRAKSFQCVVESHLSPSRKRPYQRFRIIADREHDRGTVTTASSGSGIQKSIFDGQTALFLDSRIPNQFVKEKPNSMTFASFLSASNASGTGIDLLLNDRLASQFIDPYLESIEMGEPQVLNGKTLKNVILTIYTSYGRTSQKLTIDDKDWVLYRTVNTSRDFRTSSTTTLTQTYSQIKFDEELPEKLFSTVTPKGYRAVEFLGDPNAPYEYD